MKILSLAAAAAATMTLALAPVSQTYAAPGAPSGPDCRQIQSLGNGKKGLILGFINGKVAGFREKINKRKTLVVHRASGVSFDLCKMTLVLDVTLKRKVRRDAHGKVTLKATVVSFDPFNSKRVCLSNVRVTKVSLSRTLGLGEAIYRRVANKALPDNICFKLD